MVQVADLKRTIVQRSQSYQDYDYAALQHEAILRFKAATDEVKGGYFPRGFTWFTRMLECFLRVTGQQLTLNGLETRAAAAVCESFVVALLHPKFYKTGRARTLLVATSAFDVFAVAGVPISASLRPGFGLATPLKPELLARVEAFGETQLDGNEVWLWSGWPSQNRASRVTHLPLYWVLARLGRTFTEGMYRLCNEFFAKGRASIIYGLRPLALFIRDYDRTLTPERFQDRVFVIEFWREFFVDFLVGKYDEGEGARVVTLTEQWGQFSLLVKEHFGPGNLIVDVSTNFPIALATNSHRASKRVRTSSTGEQVHTKLLTEIPLHVSDSEAIKLLFRDIKNDLAFVRNWAAHQAEMTWDRYLRRLALAAVGTAVMRGANGGSAETIDWLSSRKNPEHLANAAATLESHGFLPSDEHGGRGMYPSPLPQTAYELALPITDALVPHCFILVDAHPSITSAFLEQLELFNADGRQIGFVEADGGAVLVGVKRRRGPERAQQTIVLTDYTAAVVRQIIALTNPVRTFLRQRGNDEWRYLLLTCQRGFGRPRRVARLATATSMEQRRNSIALQMWQRDPNVAKQWIDDLVRRLSLQTVRASAGVLVYLETHSVHDMARALGHAGYAPKLLDLYLPKVIREFFQERWVRLFQNGLILEATRGSEYAVRASDFKSIEEVNAFLIEHALRLPSEASELGSQITAGSEIIFGVSAEILAMLLSISLAVEEAGGEANELSRFWSEVANALAKHIEVGNTGRPDLEGYLQDARHRANAASMEAMVRRGS